MKTLLTIDGRRLKIARNSVFNCHLSPVGRQMAIENSVSIDILSMFVDSINLFDCCLSGVIGLNDNFHQSSTTLYFHQHNLNFSY